MELNGKKQLIKQIGLLLLANLCYTLALNLFYVGNNIAAGGLAGIGTFMNYIFDFPIGRTVFILNIPICLWGLREKGWKYVLGSLITTTVYSLIVDLFSFLPTVTDDKVVACVCGGILYGIGANLSARAGISSGGTDLLAKLIITKVKRFSIGQIMMFTDGAIVVLATIAYKNIEAGIYAVLAIGVCSIVTDRLNNLFNEANIFYIFCTQNVDKISDEILFHMGRGVTLIEGEGMYKKSERPILFVVVKPHEVPMLKHIVEKYDRRAFMVLSSATEIVGEGFENLNLTATVHDEKDIAKELKKEENHE